MAKYCTNCGESLPESGNFCSNCGSQKFDPLSLENSGETLFCPSCGTNISKDSKYCPRCGNESPSSDLEIPDENKIFCSRCGTKNSKDWTHCTACGNALPSALEPPPPPPKSAKDSAPKDAGKDKAKPKAEPAVAAKKESDEYQTGKKSSLWKIIIPVAAVVVIGAVATFLLKPKPIPPEATGTLRVIPPADYSIASLYINGEEKQSKIRTPVEITVPANQNLKIEARAAGLKPYTLNLTVKQNEIREFEPDFKYGKLKIDAADNNLLAGAVTIDGKKKGSLRDNNNFILAPGSHSLKITLSAYKDFLRDLQIKNGKTKTLDYQPEIDPDGQTLLIKSAVRVTASVRIDDSGDYLLDGKELSIRIGLGPHRIVIVSKGYKTVEKDIIMSSGKAQVINYNPSMGTGMLIIPGPNAEGAELYFDGELLTDDFVKEITVSDLSLGEHVILAKRKGFEEYKTTETLKEGSLCELTIKLIALGVILRIESPTGIADAEIYIDEKSEPAALTSADKIVEIKVSEGDHSILIKHPRYVDFLLPQLYVNASLPSIAYAPPRKKAVLIIQSEFVGPTMTITDYEGTANQMTIDNTLKVIEIPWGTTVLKISYPPEYKDFDTTIFVDPEKMDTLIYSPETITGFIGIGIPYDDVVSLGPYLSVYADDKMLDFKIADRMIYIDNAPISDRQQTIKLIFKYGDYEIICTQKAKIVPAFGPNDHTTIAFPLLKASRIETKPEGCTVSAGFTQSTIVNIGKAPIDILYNQSVFLEAETPEGVKMKKHHKGDAKIIYLSVPDADVMALYDEAYSYYWEALGSENPASKADNLEQAYLKCQQAIAMDNNLPDLTYLCGLVLCEKVTSAINSPVAPQIQIITSNLLHAETMLKKARETGLEKDEEIYNTYMKQGEIKYIFAETYLQDDSKAEALKECIETMNIAIQFRDNHSLTFDGKEPLEKAYLLDKPYVIRADAAERSYRLTNNEDDKGHAIKYWDEFIPQTILIGFPPKQVENKNEKKKYEALQRLNKK